MIFGLRCSFWNQDKTKFHFITYSLLTYSFIPVLPFLPAHIDLLGIKSRGFKAKYSLFIYFATVERTVVFVHDRHTFNHWAMPQLRDLQLNKASPLLLSSKAGGSPWYEWVPGLKQMDNKKQLASLPMKDVRRSRQRQSWVSSCLLAETTPQWHQEVSNYPEHCQTVETEVLVAGCGEGCRFL